ncbi:DUF2254 domain-containing protein [Xylophilus sp. GOD-11R]|uniref:DUF2254 domain-containing protein n=1 Tax=Xylophilus sp. GOD-11R TaxID=3089814 RepID=UPI00298BE5EF|nr:DUF2254 domain-containing protein [Xylophilus sp. GOD-11R]WPB58835.1 DUF2254 domain-containing protein [Xylophilus sp. GOD-11R]
MKKPFHKIAAFLADTFWVVPGFMALLGVAGALALIEVDRRGWLVQAWAAAWLYDGGGTGARTLLGAVASSTIGVAGTVFSITIAALSLAAGQMGPRLLRNFTHDRGNQITLGAFLGTFAYALMVLRSVRTQDEGVFVPHLSLTVAIVLALACVATLVYFVGHMASRINVDTVIDLVGEEVRSAIRRLTTDVPPTSAPDASFWLGAEPVRDSRRGYLQHLDLDSLADWARTNDTAIELLVRPGDYVFPGAPIARMLPPREGADQAIRAATGLGGERSSAADLEFAIRQLVEVGVRALSKGINDPHTAISVLDRLGASLCDMACRELPGGVLKRDGRVVLVVPAVDYDGLVDAMFHMIRQDAAGSVAVLIRMVDVLAAVATCESRPHRVATLVRHMGLVLADAERSISNPSDLADLRRREARFRQVCEQR